MAAPTRAELQERCRRYESYYTDARAEMDTAKAYHDLDFKIGVPVGMPDDWDPPKPPTARTRADIAVQQLISPDPKIHRRRGNHSERQKDYDDDIEVALQAYLLDCDDYLQMPLRQTAARHLFTLGAVVLGGPWYTHRRKQVWMDVWDPRAVLLEPGPFPREAFARQELTVAEMEQVAQRDTKLASWQPQPGQRETDTLTLVRWWSYTPPEGEAAEPTAGQRAIWIEDGQGNTAGDWLLAPTTSGYPYLPFDTVYSGWGLVGPGIPIVEAYASMLHKGVRALLVAEAEAFNDLHTAARNEVHNRWRKPPGTADVNINPAPNSVSEMAQDVQPLETPTPSAAKYTDYQMIQAALADALGSRVLGGQPESGTGKTATQTMYLGGLAREKFKAPMGTLQSGYNRHLKKLGQLVHFLAETGVAESLTWRGCEIADRLYGGDYAVDVDLVAPDNEERRLKIAQIPVIKEFASPREIHEDYMGHENYAESEQERLISDVIHSEGIKAALVQATVGVVQARIADEERQLAAQYAGKNPQEILQRFAQASRVARGGFLPTQSGTVEGMAQQMGQEQQMAGAGAPMQGAPQQGVPVG